MCAGTGFVCPTCTGARWVAEHQEGDASIMWRCRDCGLEMENGWEYDAYKELAAIEFWLEQWAAGMHPYVPKPPVLNPVQPGSWQSPQAPAPEEDAAIRAAFAQPAPEEDMPF